MQHLVNGHKFVTLFYDPDINRFRDGLGDVIHDIFRLITPGQVTIFKEHKEMWLLPDVTNKFKVVLIYLRK